MKSYGCDAIVAAMLMFATIASADVAVPAPGASPRIDAIKKAGALRAVARKGG